MECPQCKNKTPVTHAYYIDEIGNKVEGVSDAGFGLFSALGGIVIGLGVAAYIFFLTLSSLKDGACDLEGISLVCTSYGGSTRLETTINLPIALVAFFGGLGAVVRGAARLALLRKSRGKIIEHAYECAACKHAWTEDLTAIPETAPE